MADPARILLVQLGGLGDIVLTAPLVAALRQRYPHAHLTLAVRDPFAAIPALLPIRPDQLLPIPFNPYRYGSPSPELNSHLTGLAAQLRGFQPDVFVAAELEPSWLSWWLAALTQPGEALTAGARAAPRGLLAVALREHNLAHRALAGPAVAAYPHETARYAALARALDAEPLPDLPWSLPPEAADLAARWLATHSLPPRQYLICFPGCATAPLLKSWPAESYAAALERFRAASGLPVLLVGDEADRPGIAGIAQRAGAEVWIGRPPDLPLLAGLVALARLYLGNDSGPMHLAQAHGVPGVAIFGGGGGWPVYSPWRPGSLGLVHTLPCFGCRWDCAFGHAVCVESIQVADVVDALEGVLERAPAEPAIRDLAAGSPVPPLVADAARSYRLARRESDLRHALLVELGHEAELRRETLTALEQAARDRLSALEQASDELTRLRAELSIQTEAAAQRARVLADLDETARAQSAEIVALRAELATQSEAATARARVIAELEQALAARARQVAELEQTARTQSAEIATQTEAAVRRAGLIAELERALDKQASHIAQREKAFRETIAHDRLALAGREGIIADLKHALAAGRRDLESAAAQIAALACRIEALSARSREFETAAAVRLEALESVTAEAEKRLAGWLAAEQAAEERLLALEFTAAEAEKLRQLLAGFQARRRWWRPWRA